MKEKEREREGKQMEGKRLKNSKNLGWGHFFFFFLEVGTFLFLEDQSILWSFSLTRVFLRCPLAHVLPSYLFVHLSIILLK